MYYPTAYMPPPPREFAALQTIPEGVVRMFPAAVWKASANKHEAIPREWLLENLIWAEKQYALDRIDTRNGRVSLTIPAATTKTKFTKELEVPAGEVWYLNQHQICFRKVALTAGDFEADFLVSCFPKLEDGSDKPYYGADARLAAEDAGISAGDVCDHDLLLISEYQNISNVDQTSGDVTSTISKVYRDVVRDFRNSDELCTELRLVEGDKLTLVVIVNEAPDADVTVDLTVWGRRGKKLVAAD